MESKTGCIFQAILYPTLILAIAYCLNNTEKVYGWFGDSNIEVVDREKERQEEKNNTLGEKEALQAVLNQYTRGTLVKGYKLGESTGYNTISSYQSYNERNKREFLDGFNLDNGRVGYLEGTVTKIDGKIRVSLDKIIIE